jgi:hypothetical protein
LKNYGDKMIELKDRDFFMCDCSSHMLEVFTEIEGDNPYIEFCMWRMGSPQKLSLWLRIKFCFLLLFKGEYHTDEVLLNKKEFVRFAKYIKNINKKLKDGTKQ